MGMAKIERKSIVVRVPVKALASAVEQTLAAGKIWQRLKITNAEAFAEDFVRALNDEDETGETLVHAMLDKAIINAFEQGADGIEEHEDQEV